jgi:protoheme ferro-lyase
MTAANNHGDTHRAPLQKKIAQLRAETGYTEDCFLFSFQSQNNMA